ncbi:allantoate amidohydrolase [Nocardioides sp. GY 10127]|uniref:allantoate amidohydrolase n=1 Tax=Nocardioides sp. GY 10127 TaxID=2569762 RepID=UPI0010A873B3|nr:allantoate amidohydrolase [Nocardioides sp. GY 10127]TIC81681.1 allantoate amidohydrolase [Nocardioides sp. GY 10127]
MSTDPTTAAGVLARCDELDRHSSLPDALERVYLSPQHRSANELAAGWMEAAGLRTWVDAAGNLNGRLEGREPGLPALVLGSHLDTVTDAGSYDGMLGVVMAIAVAQRLTADGRASELPFALELVGFSDEEGTRFGKALLGSQAWSRTWDPDWWDLRDANGVSLHQAFLDFGLDPRRVGDAGRDPATLVGYLEAHIEQGPHLEAADASLGYVTTIAGARRFHLVVHGEARHAGGTPYERRKDALVGASEIVTAIERRARVSTCIATVGRLSVHPGGVNVIPGRVDLSLDLRAATDPERDEMWELMLAEAQELCAERGLRLEVAETHSAPAVPCAGWLTDAVVAGIATTGDTEPMGLWSRAGHDAMAVANVTEVGMLFLRCFDGISHHPGEQVREVDVAAGLDAFEAAVLEVARDYAERTERTERTERAEAG